MCAWLLHYNTSLGRCQMCSYQLTSPGAIQFVKYLLTLRNVRLAFWYLLLLLSSVIHIARHVSDLEFVFVTCRGFCLIFFFFWFLYFCLCFWITEFYLLMCGYPLYNLDTDLFYIHYFCIVLFWILRQPMIFF